MFKIEIPKPCHADWKEMTPTQKGAFCASCSKEVVDFTKMSDEEVQNYFLIHSGGKTCGHFRAAQLHRIRIQLPENIFIQKIAGWKRFMAVVLLAFGTMLFGCDVGVDKTTGKIEMAKTDDSGTFTNILNSYTLPPPDALITTMGTPVRVEVDTASSNALTEITILDTINKLQGDVSFVPDLTPTTEGKVALIQIGTTDQKAAPADTADYDKIFTGGILLEKKANTLNKKPVSDTGKCHDTGYY